MSFTFAAVIGVLGTRVAVGVRVGVTLGCGVSVSVEVGIIVAVELLVGETVMVAGAQEETNNINTKRTMSLFLKLFILLSCISKRGYQACVREWIEMLPRAPPAV
jgi:hypothetical protein